MLRQVRITAGDPSSPEGVFVTTMTDVTTDIKDELHAYTEMKRMEVSSALSLQSIATATVGCVQVVVKQLEKRIEDSSKYVEAASTMLYHVMHAYNIRYIHHTAHVDVANAATTP